MLTYLNKNSFMKLYFKLIFQQRRCPLDVMKDHVMPI